MRKSKSLCSLLLVFAMVCMVLAFQNCSQVSFLVNSDPTAFKSENNGINYDGKPDGNYYRFVPDFTCESKEAPAESIAISATGSAAILVENKKLLCGTPQPMDFKSIDSSIYQNDIVGYKEGIFEGYNSLPANIPANLVEVWCRDRNDAAGIETITHFDRVSHEAVQRIYYSNFNTDGTAATQYIPDSSVARVIGQNEVIVKDEKGFELHVYRDQPASQLGLFKGHMDAVIEGKTISRETSCRLGGSLDPTLWPAQQIVDFNVTDFKTSPDLTSFAYTSDTATGIPYLYSSLVTGQRHLQVSSNNAVGSFEYMNNSNSLLYRGGGTNAFSGTGIFQTLTDGTSNTKISDGSKYFSSARQFSFTADDQYIVVPESNSETDDTNYLKILRSQSPPIFLKPLSPSPVPLYVLAFDLADSQQRIAYIMGQKPHFITAALSSLFIANLDGSHITDVTPRISLPWQLFEVTATGKYILASAQLIGSSPPQVQFYVISMDNAVSKLAPIDTQLMIYNEAFAVFIQNRGNKQYLFNFETGVSLVLPPLAVTRNSKLFSDIFFSQSGPVIGTETLANGKLQAIQVSTTSGAKTLLCPGYAAEQMHIRELEPNRFVIASYDKTTQIINVHIKPNTSSPCRKANSLPAANVDMLTLAISPDKQKVLIRTLPTTTNSTTQNIQLFYVPLNGYAPLNVSSPVNPRATIYDFSFTADSGAVIFSGDQIVPGIRNVFLWKTPAPTSP